MKIKIFTGLALAALLIVTPASAGPLRSAGKAIGKATYAGAKVASKATAKGAVRVVKTVAKVV